MAVEYRLENPVVAGDCSVRALVRMTAKSGNLGRNVFASAEKLPVAVLIETGESPKLLTLDGALIEGDRLRILSKRCVELVGIFPEFKAG